MSIGIVANVFNEPLAMPGWLAMATNGFFDDVCVVSSPPSDAPPDEETLELVKAAGVRIVHTKIDAGYGVVRTRCIRESKADWVFICDADERISLTGPIFHCEGTEKYPDTLTPNLKVTVQQTNFNYGAEIKRLITHAEANDKYAVRMCRRHWFGAPGDLTSPCQNWHTIPDWQCRLVKNSQFIYYTPERRLHEWLRDSRSGGEPAQASGDDVTGPFWEHHHAYYKPRQPEKNKQDMETYRKIDEELTRGMWLEHAAGVKE